VAENRDPKLEYQVRVSVLEVYNERIRDLLNSRSPHGGLKVRQHPKLGVQVVGLTEVAVGSFDDIDRRLEEATSNRASFATRSNSTSSRGHMMATVLFVKIEKDAKGPGRHREQAAKLHFIDLAGSEQVEAGGAAADRLREGSAINLSLTMMGNVLTALAEKSMHPKKKIAIPYKESKLTQILQDTLGGNSKTIMLAALSPADINFEETLQTLRYADRAKRIKNKAVVNTDPTQLLISQLKEENKKLMEQLQSMMKDGALPSEPIDDFGEPISEEEREEMRRQLQAEMAEQLAENQRMMEEQLRPWEERVAEADMRFAEVNRLQAEKHEKQRNTPHLINLNQDPQLSGMIVRPLRAAALFRVTYDAAGTRAGALPGGRSGREWRDPDHARARGCRTAAKRADGWALRCSRPRCTLPESSGNGGDGDGEARGAGAGERPAAGSGRTAGAAPPRHASLRMQLALWLHIPAGGTVQPGPAAAKPWL
jgi:hypothetical protein